MFFVPKNCKSIFATFSESPKDAYLMLIFQKLKKPRCLSVSRMPFTGGQRLRKTRRSGNREMETVLCKPQNLSLKLRGIFVKFHNELFFRSGRSRNGFRKPKNRRFVHSAQKP
jgi:hypothetical protein